MSEHYTATAGWQRRTIVRLPDVEAIDASTGQALCRVGELGSLATLDPAEVAALPASRFASLYHPLSDAFVAANGERPPRHVVEDRAVLQHFARCPLSLQGSAYLAAQLAAAASVATGTVAGLRRHDVALSVNATGRQVLLPDSSDLQPALVAAQAAIAAMPADIVQATALMVVILNLHPFSDGNGRVARGVFNHLIVGRGYPGFFPLGAIIARSRGGFELAIRTVELKGDWNPILTFMATALALGRIQSASAGPDTAASSTLLNR